MILWSGISLAMTQARSGQLIALARYLHYLSLFSFVYKIKPEYKKLLVIKVGEITMIFWPSFYNDTGRK